MGLFGSSEPDGPAEIMAEEAKGDTVTAKRLTTTTGGMMKMDHFSQNPLIDILRDEEKPHFYFYHPNKGLTKNSDTVGGGMSSDFRTICVVTNQRVLLFIDGNKGEAIQFGAITDIETNKGISKNRLSILTENTEYTVYIAGKTDYDEITTASEYVLEKASEAEETSADTKPIENFQRIWTEKEDSISTEEALDAEPQGGYVTREQFRKVSDVLDSDEKVHFITRGSTVDVEGSGAGSSLFGDDRSRKSGSEP